MDLMLNVLECHSNPLVEEVHEVHRVRTPYEPLVQVTYRKVGRSQLETRFRFYRLLIKGKFDVYFLIS